MAKENELKKTLDEFRESLEKHFQNEGGWERRVSNIETCVIDIRDRVASIDANNKLATAAIERHVDDDRQVLGAISMTLVKMDDKLDNVDVTLVKQQVILDEHARRSTTNELRLEEEKKLSEARIEKLDEKLQPVRDQYKNIMLFLKIGAGIMASGASGFGIKELVAWLTGI